MTTNMKVTIDIRNLVEKRFNLHNHYDPGYSVYSEGELFDGVFYILDGNVQIIKSGLTKKITMRYCEANEFIGVIPYFDHSKIHSTSALVAKPGATLVHINEQEFSDFISEYQDIRNEITNELCQMINLTEMQIVNSIQTDRYRFIDTIAFLAAKQYKNKSQFTERTLFIRLTEEHLAELARLSIKSLKKLLSEYTKNELLIVQQDKLTILDYEKFLASR